MDMQHKQEVICFMPLKVWVYLLKHNLSYPDYYYQSYFLRTVDTFLTYFTEKLAIYLETCI